MKLEQPIWPRFLPSGWVMAFATLGPLGRLRRAPGTWGSLAGLLYFTVFFHPFGFMKGSVFWTLLFSLPGLYLAMAMCGEAEFRLGRRDPGEVVLDEFAAMPLCYLAWPALLRVWPPWAIFVAGFLAFRLYDIV
ncbi:MAG: phosphatidylglycerophosphatase A, partial [Verrucomicrobia bacterium RIFCSPLOWO2_12_FULL_64_8]